MVALYFNASAIFNNTGIAAGFREGVSTNLSDGKFNAILQWLNGRSAAEQGACGWLPVGLSIPVRASGPTILALGSSTINAAGKASVTYTLVPDPNNPNQGTIRVTVDQPVELYDRYDWGAVPIAYNPVDDTVVIPGDKDFGTPILIINNQGQVIGTHPAGTDISTLPGHTYVEFPPDGPDMGAAAAQYAWFNGGNVGPMPTSPIFGTPDHPDPYNTVDKSTDMYAGEFHAIEAHGGATPYQVYSQWSYQQSFTVPYTVVNGTIVTQGGLTVDGNPIHTDSGNESNFKVEYGQPPPLSQPPTPINTLPPPVNPKH
jgi:hypothetical protein